MKIICIGRNYLSHVAEMNNNMPEKPLFFLKPETAVILHKQPFFYPDFSDNIHYEAEIVIKIARLGKSIPQRFAHTYYNELTLGIDFTARDLQEKCIQEGLPWEIAKSFDGAACVGRFINKQNFSNLLDLNFSLKKNDILVQNGTTKDMIFSIDALISYVSQFFTLKIGDLIFTGTPAGVGPVEINDVLEGYIMHEKVFSLPIK